MHFLNRAALAALLSATLAAPALAQGTTLGFSPSSATVAVGDAVVLDIVLRDRPGTRPVAFFDFDLVFNPAVLSFTGLSLGDALGRIDLGQAVDASLPPDLASGVLNMSVLSLLADLSAQPLSPVLGRVSFSAIGLGDAGIGFGFTAMEDLTGSPIGFAAIDASVGVVPEPAAFWMLGAGVLAVAARAAVRRGLPARVKAQ